MVIRIIATGSAEWERLIRRWGVSFLIGEDVLFDTFGDPGVLINNMRKFHVDTARIKHIVLSHDDWDHIAGLWYLLSDRQDITVYVCPKFKREIKARITSFGVRLIEAGGPVRIKEDIYSTGELYGGPDGRKIYEQSIVVKANSGLAIICGCAHPGAVNIVKHAKENFQEDVDFLIGGLHLKDNTRQKNIGIIKELRELGIKRVAPMHCTGRGAVRVIKAEFRQGFMHAEEGDKLEL